jgi:alkyl hydroperoxide reductase subunit AhpC
VRTVFVIGPDRKIKLTMAYPMTTGRNFDEILRAIDALQLTARHGLATPAQWQPGEALVIPPALDDGEAREKFGEFDQPLPYLRTVVPSPVEQSPG